MAYFNKGRVIYLFILIIATLILLFKIGFKGENFFLIPIIFLFFYIAARFDVPIRGLGYVNADHIVVFPAAFLISNSFIVGLLCATSYITERILREGIKKIKAGNIISFFAVIINTTISSELFLKLKLYFNPSNEILRWFYLCLVLILFSSLGFTLLVVDKLFSRVKFEIVKWNKHFIKYVGFLILTSPFLALLLYSLSKKDISLIILSSIPLISNIWFLKVNFRYAEQNESLIEMNKKMEFLQQLLLRETGTLDNEDFLKELLEGIKEFVPWDFDLLFITSMEYEKEPIIFSLTSLPIDTHSAISYVESVIETKSPLREPLIPAKNDFKPILSTESNVQLIVPLSTNEITFGILVIERKENKSFSPSEIQFLHSSFSLVARSIQDRILKGQLLTTNHTLLKQTHYLSEILKISNLLKIHLNSQEILEEVAKGISESIGFQRVLISLYRREKKHFERIAQSGLNDVWVKISSVQPPEEHILRHFKDEYKIGNCYFVRNLQPTPYTIMPNTKKKDSFDSWQPDDALFIPLISSNNLLLGVISVDEPRDGKIPSLETINALEILANQAVHALESSRIHFEAKQESIVDGLTNLYNHRYFQESLSKLVNHSLLSNRPFSILMMDLDNFKEINDNYGHLAGDEVLRAVGETLIEVTRKNDIAARYGGEEFAVLLEGLDSNEATMVAERIRTLVEKKVIKEDSTNATLSVTISIGISTFPKHGKEHKDLLKVADIALYRAKQAGKNRIAEGP